VPNNAISAGDGLYVGRVRYDKSVLPGSVSKTGKREITYVYSGRTQYQQAYEMLIGVANEFSWQQASYDNVPECAVPVGYNRSKQNVLYVGRAVDAGKRVVGTVQPGYGFEYSKSNSVGRRDADFEVLCYDRL